VEDHCHVLAGSLTILARKKISFQNIESGPWAPRREDGVEARQFARGPGKTDNVPKAPLQQRFEHSGSYETSGARHQDPIAPPYDERIRFF
jgi:hypothetical protein